MLGRKEGQDTHGISWGSMNAMWHVGSVIKVEVELNERVGDISLGYCKKGPNRLYANKAGQFWRPNPGIGYLGTAI